MTKMRLGPKPFLLPQPAVLVGTVVDGKPNFMMAAWCGVVNHVPPMVTVAVRPSRHTERGIVEHGVFSLNIPRADLVARADYCGLVSGSRADKSEVFQSVTGVLEAAPIIVECPLALECRLIQTHGLPTHNLHVGEVVEVHAEEACLVEGVPEMSRVDPLVYSITDGNYWRVGPRVGRAFQEGRGLKT